MKKTDAEAGRPDSEALRSMESVPAAESGAVTRAELSGEGDKTVKGVSPLFTSAVVGKYPAAFAERAAIPCQLCEATAGELTLYGTADEAMVTLRSGLGDMNGSVGGRFDEFRQLIAEGDVRGLHALDPEYVPFYCPQCDRAMCVVHWKVWDEFEGSWHDSTRGLCPQGHQRMLRD